MQWGLQEEVVSCSKLGQAAVDCVYNGLDTILQGEDGYMFMH